MQRREFIFLQKSKIQTVGNIKKNASFQKMVNVSSEHSFKFKSLICNIYNRNNIGPYRDEGLEDFKNTSGLQSEKIKKTFQKMFKYKGLGITINCNMRIVNYLAVTLNLNDGSYRPYKKPNEETNHVHVNSDHPHPF